MKTLFENMLRSLVRFKVATLLNVIGLSVAFASFMIIMMQVYQELTFDTCYSTSEYLYSVERQRAPGESYTSTMSRPMGWRDHCPFTGIRKGAYRNCSSSNKYWAYDPLKGGTSAVQEVVFGASDDFLKCSAWKPLQVILRILKSVVKRLLPRYGRSSLWAQWPHRAEYHYPKYFG